MAEPKQIEFEELPSHVLEYIFYYIPLPEIVRLSAVSPIFLMIGDSVIRKKFFELHSGIYKELRCLKQELDLLPKTEEFYQNKIVVLRSYYFMEMLLSELSLIRAVWRNILYSKDSSTVSIGKLLHEFYSAFYITKSRNLPPWYINDETEGKIIKYAKLFFECKLKDVEFGGKFGSQILDVLDSTINRQYTVNVKYQPENNQCYIEAVYKLRNPHYLNRPPKLNKVDGVAISAEDRKRILSYFVSLVRINNRVTLREEQYHRESEASRSTEMNLLGLEDDLIVTESTFWLNKEVRYYDSLFSNPRREERKLDETYEFEETYRSAEFSHSTSIEKKFICNINIKCPLNEAPLTIMDCWSRLRSDLLSQLYAKPQLSFLEESLDKMSVDSKQSDIGEYTLQCIVEVCVMSNNNHFEVLRLHMNEP